LVDYNCDFHTRYQQIATVDEATGEAIDRRLEHENGEAHTFYRGPPARVWITPHIENNADQIFRSYDGGLRPFPLDEYGSHGPQQTGEGHQPDGEGDENEISGNREKELEVHHFRQAKRAGGVHA
jgi:hypothetical protein